MKKNDAKERIRQILEFLKDNPKKLITPSNYYRNKEHQLELQPEAEADAYYPYKEKGTKEQYAICLAGITSLNLLTGKKMNAMDSTVYMEFFKDKPTNDLFSGIKKISRLEASLIEQMIIKMPAKRKPASILIEHSYFHEEELPEYLRNKLIKEPIKFLNHMFYNSSIPFGKGSYGEVKLLFKSAKSDPTIRYYIEKKILVKNDYIKKTCNREIEINEKIRVNNIPGCIQTFEEKRMKKTDGCKLRMKYFAGIDLDKYLDAYILLSENETRYIIKPIMEALHALGSIAYRDLKPSNIMVGNMHGSLTGRLIDFGASTEESADTLIGTPAYLAPEVATSANKKEYTNLCDIYSLGMTVYQMLFGRLILNEGKIADDSSYKKKVECPKERGLSMACLDFIEKCVQYYPELRFQSMSEAMEHPFFDLTSKEANSIQTEKYVINLYKPLKTPQPPTKKAMAKKKAERVEENNDDDDDEESKE